MFEENEENCLDKLASLVAEAGDGEGSDRSGSMAEGRLGASVRMREWMVGGDCLRSLPGPTDMSLRRERKEEGVKRKGGGRLYQIVGRSIGAIAARNGCHNDFSPWP